MIETKAIKLGQGKKSITDEEWNDALLLKANGKSYLKISELTGININSLCYAKIKRDGIPAKINKAETLCTKYGLDLKEEETFRKYLKHKREVVTAGRLLPEIIKGNLNEVLNAVDKDHAFDRDFNNSFEELKTVCMEDKMAYLYAKYENNELDDELFNKAIDFILNDEITDKEWKGYEDYIRVVKEIAKEHVNPFNLTDKMLAGTKPIIAAYTLCEDAGIFRRSNGKLMASGIVPKSFYNIAEGRIRVKFKINNFRDLFRPYEYTEGVIRGRHTDFKRILWGSSSGIIFIDDAGHEAYVEEKLLKSTFHRKKLELLRFAEEGEMGGCTAILS